MSPRTDAILLRIARRSQRLWAVLRSSIVEFVVCPVIASGICSVLVEEGDHINDGLWILLLLLFRDAVGLQRSLPFLGKSLDCTSANASRRVYFFYAYREFSCFLVVAHVSDMYWIFRS